MSGAMALIALGVGYLVYLHASKEKEGVRLLGQVIGIFMMIAAVICFMYSGAKTMRNGGHGMGQDNCPMMSKKAPMCPLGGKEDLGPHE